jgi:hypothetical protein
MDKMEKMKMMDKLVRELEDLTNSQTSLLKKIGQIEADNINLGNTLLEKKLPDIFEKIDEALTEANALQADFTEVRDKFVKDNRLDEVLPGATG